MNDPFSLVYDAIWTSVVSHRLVKALKGKRVSFIRGLENVMPGAGAETDPRTAPITTGASPVVLFQPSGTEYEETNTDVDTIYASFEWTIATSLFDLKEGIFPASFAIMAALRPLRRTIKDLTIDGEEFVNSMRVFSSTFSVSEEDASRQGIPVQKGWMQVINCVAAIHLTDEMIAAYVDDLPTTTTSP